ncbi:MAG: PaaI family thioesterase [Myxococcales bacterium]|nr:PaaI family thioesterase [Polyangiaceae bacterium]MDW8249676.1 PaaI family thioesterase [Myxococcales bacterium]
MSQVSQLMTEARRRGELSPLLTAIPYARFLGLTASLEGTSVVCRLTYAEHLIGNPALPALHGGTVGALLESAAIFQLLWSQESKGVPKIITLTVDYLRSARPMDTLARAQVTRQGRRVASVRAIAWQEDEEKPVATANAHFLLSS